MAKPNHFTVSAIAKDASTRAGICGGEWSRESGTTYTRVYWEQGEHIATDKGVVYVKPVISVMWSDSGVSVSLLSDGFEDGLTRTLPDVRTSADSIRSAVHGLVSKMRAQVQKDHELFRGYRPVIFERKTRDYPGHRLTGFTGEATLTGFRMDGTPGIKDVRLSVRVSYADESPEPFAFDVPEDEISVPGVTGVWETDTDTANYLDGYTAYSSDRIGDAIAAARANGWQGFGIAFNGAGEPVSAKTESDGPDYGQHLCAFALAVAETEAILEAANAVDPDSADMHDGTVIFDASNPLVSLAVARVCRWDAADHENRITAIEREHALSILVNSHGIPEEYAPEVLSAIHEADGGDCPECEVYGDAWNIPRAVRAAGHGWCGECETFMTGASHYPDDALCGGCADAYGQHDDDDGNAIACDCLFLVKDTAKHIGHAVSKAKMEEAYNERCPSLPDAPEYGNVANGPNPDGDEWEIIGEPVPGISATLPARPVASAVRGDIRPGKDYVITYAPDNGDGTETVTLTSATLPTLVYSRTVSTD